MGPALALACGSIGAFAFAAGPEGGLSTEEVLQASERGFEVVSLGRFILRAETVPPRRSARSARSNKT